MILTINRDYFAKHKLIVFVTDRPYILHCEKGIFICYVHRIDVSKVQTIFLNPFLNWTSHTG